MRNAATMLIFFVLGPGIVHGDSHDAIHDHSSDTATPAMALTMYKSPTCGCCGEWAEHMRAHGFSVEEIATDDMDAVKARHAVPAGMRSCHTATVNGLVVEGHVPARDILDLLGDDDRRRGVDGIAVPRMPLGSPGMDFGREQRYASYVFSEAGEPEVFREHVPGTPGYSGKGEGGHADHQHDAKADGNKSR